MSDSEDECFESAAESLDEEEEENPTEKKGKVIKSLAKSESEVAEPVVSKNDAVGTKNEEDVTNNSTKYRKRPERVKHSTSIGSIGKGVPSRKSPARDSFFNTESVPQPDVLFQDITNNLSRNINKSLNTIQQKSSNVKDLILNSLPITSPHESEGFSYDDNKDFCYVSSDSSYIDKETIKSELVHDSHSKEPLKNVPCDPVQFKVEEKHESKTTIEKDTKKNDISEKNKGRKASDFIKENTEVKQKKSYLGATVSKESLERRSTIQSSKNVEFCDLSENDEKDSAGDACDILAKNQIENEITSVNKISQASTISISTKVFEELNRVDENEIKDEEEFLGAPGPGEPSGDWNDSFLPGDIDEDEDDEEDEDGEEEEQEEDLGAVVSESKESEFDLKCNVEELKMALKNIVNDESETVSGNFNEGSHVKEPEKTMEHLNESSKDGWDDFDFSDTEDDGAEVDEGWSFENKKKVEKLGECNLKTPNIIQPTIPKESNIKESRKENLVTAKHISDRDSKQDSIEMDDNWGWGDDEDVSKGDDDQEWPGWETFGQKQEPKQEEKQGNWGLGSWGVNMLLNKATAVTQGISNVLEAGLGAPDPETLARMEKQEMERLKEQGVDIQYEEPTKKNSLSEVNLFGITNLVAGVTSKIVEHSKIQEIGSKVISGGLDTLENFGKKTMEVLQEGDPGLKNKRALLLGSQKPVLSQILREAREKADMELKKVEEKELAKKCHFETLFDDFQGMVHLEALEMLSRLCDLKLEQTRSSMTPEEREDLEGVLEEVEQLCALDEYDTDMKSSVADFKMALQLAVQPLKDEISVTNIIEIHEKVSNWLQSSTEGSPSSVIIHQKVVATLAELTAAAVHQFHKGGELLSIKECRKTVEEVDTLSRLTSLLCMEIGRICENFSSLVFVKCQNELSPSEIKSLNEKITTGMQNSTSYIRHAFKLLIPVLQIGAAV